MLTKTVQEAQMSNIFQKQNSNFTCKGFIEIPFHKSMKVFKLQFTPFQLCFGIHHQEGPREPGRSDIE
jgi:hypothetical protein